MAIRKIQEDILTLYGVDASKYEKEHAKLKIQRVYNLIPSNLENKKKRMVAKNIEGKKVNGWQIMRKNSIILSRRGLL